MKRKKVLIIGLDGCRPDALLAAKTPNIDGLVTQGVYSWHAQTEIHSISGPAWLSLLSGVHMDKHKVTDNDFEPRDLTYTTIFKDLREWNPSLIAVAYSHWEPIITGIFEEGVLDESGSGSDEVCADNLAKAIRENRGDLYFLQLDDIDDAGHKHTYSPKSQKYLDMIERNDGFVGPILEAVAQCPEEEEWLVICVSDHGGSGKGHGKPTLDDLTIVFIIAGTPVLEKGELPGVEDEAPYIVDIVSTIARFMGMPPKAYWDGKSRGL